MPTSDPLAQLRPLQLPEPVSFWPPAPGWWLLALLLIGALITALLLIRRRLRRSSFLRPSLTELDRISAFYHRGEYGPYIQQLNELLKRVSLACHSRECAALSGDNWLRFLDQTGRSTEFTEGVGQLLGNAPYRPNVTLTNDQAQALNQLVKRWIRKQRRGSEC